MKVGQIGDVVELSQTVGEFKFDSENKEWHPVIRVPRQVVWKTFIFTIGFALGWIFDKVFFSLV